MFGILVFALGRASTFKRRTLIRPRFVQRTDHVALDCMPQFIGLASVVSIMQEHFFQNLAYAHVKLIDRLIHGLVGALDECQPLVHRLRRLEHCIGQHLIQNLGGAAVTLCIRFAVGMQRPQLGLDQRPLRKYSVTTSL